jgi:hypothetical protein
MKLVRKGDWNTALCTASCQALKCSIVGIHISSSSEEKEREREVASGCRAM